MTRGTTGSGGSPRRSAWPSPSPEGLSPRVALSGGRAAGGTRLGEGESVVLDNARSVSLLLRLAGGPRAPTSPLSRRHRASPNRLTGAHAAPGARARVIAAMSAACRREPPPDPASGPGPGPRPRPGVGRGPASGAGRRRRSPLPLRAEAWAPSSTDEVPSWNPSAFSGTPSSPPTVPALFHPLMVALTPLAPFRAFQLLDPGLPGPGRPSRLRLGTPAGGGAGRGVRGRAGFRPGPLPGRTPGRHRHRWWPPRRCPLVLLAFEVHLARPRAASAALLALRGRTGAPRRIPRGGRGRGAAPGGASGRRRRSAVRFDGLRFAVGDGGRASRAGRSAGVLLAAPQLVPTLLALRGAGAPARPRR